MRLLPAPVTLAEPETAAPAATLAEPETTPSPPTLDEPETPAPPPTLDEPETTAPPAATLDESETTAPPPTLGEPEGDCPSDVVDRLLWRNAQRIMSRHAVRLNGTCHWCDQAAPCDARRLAVRAAEVARMPWREAWHARNEITGMLPVVTAQLRRGGANGGRDAIHPGVDRGRPAPERVRPVARSRTRTWIRINVVRREPA